MRVGIVAEGRGDLAVLVNVLKGALGLDFEDIQFLRPEYDLDETDLQAVEESQRGGWVRVKSECQDRRRIREFMRNAIDDEFFVVVQIDTAEAHEKGYDVERPARGSAGYAEQLRERVVAKINKWLEGEGVERVRHAVAVEEIEAWILTLFSTKDTTTVGEPKEQLLKALNKALTPKERKQHFQRKAFGQAYEVSRPFRKTRELEKAARRNPSLQAFVTALTRR